MMFNRSNENLRKLSTSDNGQQQRFDIDERRPARNDWSGDFNDLRKRSIYPRAVEIGQNEFGDIDQRMPLRAKSISPDRDDRRRRVKRRCERETSEERRAERGRKRQRCSPEIRRRKDVGQRSASVKRPVGRVLPEEYRREDESRGFGLEPIRNLSDKFPDLCRYFKNGYCHHGRRCRFLHGEFPCKYFHNGDCTKGKKCRFSHDPLNEITKPVYEKMIENAEVSVPEKKSPRKALLEDPPAPVQRKMESSEKRSVCKYFRSGICRVGDLCLRSHILEPSHWESSEGRSELCEIYRMSGDCPNGLRCAFLHGEFRCKVYHQGECTKAKGCRFLLHESVNELSKPLYEKLTKDQEPAAEASVPDAESMRKVLFGTPPPLPMLWQSSDQTQSTYWSPSPLSSSDTGLPLQQHGWAGFGGKPPSLVTISQPPPEVHYSKFACLKSNQLPMAFGMDCGIDTDEVLEEFEESPASPEPTSKAPDLRSRPKIIAHVAYRLIPFDMPPPKPSPMSAALLQATLANEKLRDDPRVQNLLASQFNAGFDLLLETLKE